MKIKTFVYLAIVCSMLVSFSSNAQVNWYWSKQADSASEFASYDAVDRNNNAYYTGYYNGGTRVSFLGGIGLSTTASQSDFLVKYNPAGTPLWARNAKALAAGVSIYGMAVATDRNNNVLETGYYNDSIAFGAFHLTAKTAPDNSYLVKYDPSGNVIWATSPTYASKPVNNQASYVATDKQNNIWVTGTFRDTVLFGKDTVTSQEIDMFLVKYGPSGHVIWARAPFPKNASSSMYGTSVAVDDSGNAYVTGSFTDSVKFGAITIVTNPITTNIYIVKYDSSGNVKWAKDIPATPGGVYPTPVTVDNSGNVYVAAQFNNVSLTLGPSVVTDGASPCSNSMVVKYDNNGNILWATCARYVSSDEVCVIVESSLATDRCNNLYWSGVCSDTFSVGKVNVTVPGSGAAPSTPFGYVIKLDSNGTALGGAGIANQTTQYFSNGLAVDSFSRVFYDGAFIAPASLVIGIDTLKRYLSDATSFLSKFSIGQQINSKGKDTICPGDSILISVVSISGTTYKWSTGATTDSIYVKPLITTTYFVVTSNSCNVDSSFVTIAVANSKAKIAGTDSICKGDTILLKGSGGGTYAWSTGATTSSIKVNPLINTTYTLTVKNGVCTGDTTFTVKVLPVPVPLITVKPASDTICVGDSAMLIASGGNTYFWPVPGSTKDTIWVKPAITTTYQLQASNGSCKATVSQKIVVLNNSSVSLILRNDSICPNDSSYLVVSGGISYKWAPGGATTDSIKVKPASTTTYTVYIVNACGKDTLSKTLHIVFPLVTTSGNTAICRGSNTNISATGGTSYIWSPGGSTNSTINVNPIKTTTYSVVVSNGRCFKDTTITVTVDTPSVLTITPNQKLCIGDSTMLSATGGPGYKWSNGATTSSITVKPNTTTTYTCVVTKNGCIDSTSTIVTVDAPTLNACCDTTITKGSSAVIHADSATNYFWSPNSSLSCDTCTSPLATPTVTTTYTVLTKDGSGCTVERTVTIFVETPCADFAVPNIFTPNNDGINDDFVINVLNPSSYSIDIFDRWGNEVYTSGDPTVYWNGKLLKTQYLVPDGVYYYIVKASCGSNNYLKKGFVQVVGEK